jgi:leucyl-tRNA synthetase
MSVDRYNARAAEIHWQQVWDRQPGYSAPETFPRQSGRLHMDHVRHDTMQDVVARYKRAGGCNVLPLTETSGIGKASTSTRNTIDPGDIIDTYGTDATRWFVLSDSPPERDAVWMETGVHGAWRFVQRLWRIVNDAQKFSQGAPASRPAEFSAPALEVRKTAHRALAQVSGNIERTRFNVCVAHIYAFARALEAVVAISSEPASPDLKFAAREAAEIMVQLFHPMMPHLAEECWAALGHEGLLATQSWPTVEAGLLVEDTITLPVHVNGKKRADLTIARDTGNDDIEASVLALDAIKRVLDGRAPRKVIIVPQRIVNVVA